MNIFNEIAHRPWPLPRGPWVMAQSWHDLLFAHWPISTLALRTVVPEPLELDVHSGSAWFGVVPFRMSGVRVRCTPSVPGLSAFPELNLRTYVTYQGKPGVYFFCLEAANRAAVRIARRWFHLPYFDAQMSCANEGDDVRYSSRRTHAGAKEARFAARYGPASGVARARAGTLEHWLTERYCLYTFDARGRVLRADIHHEPWPLQQAWCEIEECTLPRAHGLVMPSKPPLVHFARRLDVVVWPIARA